MELPQNHDYYVNYEYLQWKNKPVEEAATPIIGFHRNPIKPFKSFKEMLAEKRFNDEIPPLKKIPEENISNQNPMDKLPKDHLGNIFGTPQYPVHTMYQPKKFDINSIMSPLTTSQNNLYNRNKGNHSTPQSPVVPLPISKPEQRIPPPFNNEHNPPMQTHPGYNQFKKEIFDNNLVNERPQQYEDQQYMGNNFPSNAIDYMKQSPQAHISSIPSGDNSYTERYTGRLKFFDEAQNYGFFVLDIDNSDLFVHYEDLRKAGVNKEFLKAIKGNAFVKFTFNCVTYYGKYSLSRKAINIEYYFEQGQKPPYPYNMQ